MKKISLKETPNIETLQKELNRVRHNKKYIRVIKSTIYTLITVAAIAVLVATLWLPVLQIYGSSMTPTLNDGEIVFSLKTDKFKPGDVLAFYYNNKILIKRVICTEGQWIDIDGDGNVYVDSKRLDEPYIKDKSLGYCDIEFPYQVPDGKVFVMGDHRETSIDSRSLSVGCVSEEQIVGKILFRVWPLGDFGVIK